MTGGGKISVVIPTLNAGGELERCLAALDPARQSGLVGEVIVVDGGSTDGTAAIAERAEARVLVRSPNRGGQLAAGAQAARGPWLLFLHADTVLGPGWEDAVAAFTADPANAGRAAAFRFRLDDASRAARWLEAVVAWRCRRFGLPYGDQGLLIVRGVLERLGGIRPLAIMEDVDIVLRIGRHRRPIVMLDPPATTSAVRYRRSGYLRRTLRNAICLGLYFAGVPPRIIARIYR